MNCNRRQIQWPCRRVDTTQVTSPDGAF